MTPPLVSIGIPTFRRPQEVRRAALSALAQDHENVEVVVSDDAGGGDTAAVLGAIAERDPRLRFVVQPSNLGHARNFQTVLDLATGDYFMWLSDDDWIDPGYVSACLRALADDPDCALAVGRPLYERPDATEPQLENPTNLLASSPTARVLRYFATVDVNGPLYGVGRRSERPEFTEVLGGDWLVVGALAYRGRVRTVEGVHVHRSLAGMSTESDFHEREFGLPGNRHLATARSIAGGIRRDYSGFADVAAPRRALLAAGAVAGIVPRFVLIDWAREGLRRVGLLPAARRLIAPLRARRHS